MLLELETDKATVEIVAEHTGKLEIKKKEGETVRVGDVLAIIDKAAAGTEAPAAAAPQPAAAPPKPAAASAPASAQQAQSHAGGQHSPAVTKLLNETGANPDAIKGTGRGDRLTKNDVVQHISGGKAAPAGSSAPAQAPAPAPTPLKPAGPPRPSGERTTRREPMSMLRRRIAQRLVEAQQTNAILTTFNEINMQNVIEVRKTYKDKFKEVHGVNLGFMSFFVKAAVEALQAFLRLTRISKEMKSSILITAISALPFQRIAVSWFRCCATAKI